MLVESFRIQGAYVRDHRFVVPLVHARLKAAQNLDVEQVEHLTGPELHVWARELVSSEKSEQDADKLPWLVYLNGGPGCAPDSPVSSDGWLKRALQDYRVLLVEQRGTGRSRPVTLVGLNRLQDAATQANYLSLFRADSIVCDLELIRRELLGESGRWTVLGQSFGGFCLLTYASFFPDSLEGGIFTGGVPGAFVDVDEVYRHCYRQVLAHNGKYFERFPKDRLRLNRLADRLENDPFVRSSGDRLTRRLVQTVGMRLGVQHGDLAVHAMLCELDAVLDSAANHSSHVAAGLETFGHRLQQWIGWRTTPLYFLLHEAIYAQGSATRWSAHRVRKEFAEIDDPSCLGFTGEMMYPWMCEDLAHFRPFQELAELLALKEDWGKLYDHEKLMKNKTPLVAVVYYDDMMVPSRLSESTLASVPNVRSWVTNAYDHSGLRSHGFEVLSRSLSLLKGEPC